MYVELKGIAGEGYSHGNKAKAKIGIIKAYKTNRKPTRATTTNLTPINHNYYSKKWLLKQGLFNALKAHFMKNEKNARDFLSSPKLQPKNEENLLVTQQTTWIVGVGAYHLITKAAGVVRQLIRCEIEI